MKRLLLALCALLLTGSLSYAQISHGGSPPSQRLSLDDNTPTIVLPAVDEAAYLAEDEAAGWNAALRFGIPHDLNVTLENSGRWTELRDGSRVWRLRFLSAGARSLNFQMSEFTLPAGAQLFLYNDDRDHFLGGFTSANNKTGGRFATQPVKGEAVTLELVEPADARGQSVMAIWRVVHAYRGFFNESSPLDDFGDAADCAINVNCPEGANWQDEKRAVALIVSADGTRVCSGSLINNSNHDGRPLYLTAEHCTMSQTVGTWVFWFNYESPTCENIDGPTDQSVAGATLLMTHNPTDFALLELSSPVPLQYNPYFAGWNATETPPTSSACISHPAVDIKKIAWDDDPCTSGSYGDSPPNSHWNAIQWEDGSVEPGSSGSPLFDQNGRTVGQCSGGDGWCDDVTNHNVHYGKLSISYDAGADEWLDPVGTPSRTIDGFDPNVAGFVSGVVRDQDSNLPLEGVRVDVVDGTQRAFTNADGEYLLPLAEGTYDLNYSLWGYETSTIEDIVVTEGVELEYDVLMSSANIVTLLDEDFEGGATGWTHSAVDAGWGDEWHLSTERASSGATSWKCGDSGTGDYGASLDARLSSPVIEELPADARLSFDLFIQSETSGAFEDSAYDGGVLEISVDGVFESLMPIPGYPATFRHTSGGGSPVSGPMPGLSCFAGNIGGTDWPRYEVDLSNYEGQNIQLHFRFGSDAAFQMEGWHIDDVLLQGVSAAPPEVTGVTIAREGNDVLLRWDGDATPYYRVFSGASPEFDFPAYEGMTQQTSFTIANGTEHDSRFYYVVGSFTP